MLKKKVVILTDIDKCIGCQACVVACKQENLSFATHPARGAIKILKVGPWGSFPDLHMYFLPLQCNHCEDPACVPICPTQASIQREDGVVLIDHGSCSLCQDCISACPYGERQVNVETNRVDACTFCFNQLEKGQIPTCISVCPAKARFFGDPNEEESELSCMMRERNASVFSLPKPDETENRSGIFYRTHGNVNEILQHYRQSCGSFHKTDKSPKK